MSYKLAASTGARQMCTLCFWPGNWMWGLSFPNYI